MTDSPTGITMNDLLEIKKSFDNDMEKLSLEDSETDIDSEPGTDNEIKIKDEPTTTTGTNTKDETSTEPVVKDETAEPTTTTGTNTKDETSTEPVVKDETELKTVEPVVKDETKLKTDDGSTTKSDNITEAKLSINNNQPNDTALNVIESLKSVRNEKNDQQVGDIIKMISEGKHQDAYPYLRGILQSAPLSRQLLDIYQYQYKLGICTDELCSDKLKQIREEGYNTFDSDQLEIIDKFIKYMTVDIKENYILGISDLMNLTEIMFNIEDLNLRRDLNDCIRHIELGIREGILDMASRAEIRGDGYLVIEEEDS